MKSMVRRIGLAAGGALIVAACGPISSVEATDGNTETDATESITSTSDSDSSTSEPTSDASTTAPVPEPVCTPGETRCDEDGFQETCTKDGLSWVAEACPEARVCTPCEDATCTEDLCLSACDLAESSSAGCSFLAARQLGLTEILGPLLDVPEEDWSPDGLLLVNSSDQTATVQLHDLAQGSTTPAPVGDPLVLAPGAAELIDLPTPLPLGGISTLRIGSLVWAESDVPIVAYSYSPAPPFLGNDSSMLLPERSLGRHYVVPSFPPHYMQFQGAGQPTYFDVIATAPNTEVRWLAQYAQTAGTGIPIEPVEIGKWSTDFTVDRFGGMRIMADRGPGIEPQTADVSGTLVQASEPIYVIAGSRCSAVPATDDFAAGCDPLMEALIPLEQWGQTYVVPPPPATEVGHHYYRIYSGDPGVRVTTSPPILVGGEHVFETRGEYIDVDLPHGTTFVVEADGPVMVVGYLASRNTTGSVGDPAMYQHVPVEQADDHYVLGAPADWDAQYVQVTRGIGGPAVTLDGEEVADWASIGGFQTSSVLVESGVHALESDGPFTAIQFGYNNSEGAACDAYDSSSVCHSSYAHPVGMRTEILFEP